MDKVVDKYNSIEYKIFDNPLSLDWIKEYKGFEPNNKECPYRIHLEKWKTYSYDVFGSAEHWNITITHGRGEDVKVVETFVVFNTGEERAKFLQIIQNTYEGNPITYFDISSGGCWCFGQAFSFRTQLVKGNYMLIENRINNK